MKTRYDLLRVTWALLMLLTAVPGMTEDALVFGIHPLMRPSDVLRAFTPLVDRLAVGVEQPVRIEVSRDYRSHIQAMGENRLDIAYLGPVPYVRLVAEYGAVPILGQLQVAGSNTFRGVIVVRGDSAIKNLADLAGKRFAFGDPQSTMGHLVPRFMLLQAGVPVAKLGQYDHVANHTNVALDVLAGLFDAGAIKEDVFRKFESQGLTALAWTPAIAGHLLVARRDMPDQAKERLQAALFDLANSAEGRAALRAIEADATAFVPGRDADYDNLREILAALAKVGVMP